VNEKVDGSGIASPNISIVNGVRWLKSTIVENIEELEKRTEADSARWLERQAEKKVCEKFS
jgi:hypothetical protein